MKSIFSASVSEFWCATFFFHPRDRLVRFHTIHQGINGVITSDTRSQYSSFIVTEIRMTHYSNEFKRNRKAAKKIRLQQNRKKPRKVSRAVNSLNEHKFVATPSDSDDLNRSQNHLQVLDIFSDMEDRMPGLEEPNIEGPGLEGPGLEGTGLEGPEINDIIFAKHAKRGIPVGVVKEDPEPRRIVMASFNRVGAIRRVVTRYSKDGTIIERQDDKNFRGASLTRKDIVYRTG